MLYDALIIGGGPAGLSAALTLGRARRSALLLDAGPARNAAAAQVHNLFTRDGTPPAELRSIARAQLAAYPQVRVQDARVERVEGARGAFSVWAGGEVHRARRLLLCLGMIDEMIDLEGFAAMWGRSIVICPYCHGWEVQDRRMGVLAQQPEQLEFALMLRGWSAEVVVLTGGALPIPPEQRARLTTGGVAIDERPLRRLLGEDGVLHAVEFDDGAQRPLEVLFARPPQRQQPVVAALGLALDGHGFVQVDPMRRETSSPGVYAAGDLCTPMQAAAAAVGQGLHAAAALNHELTVELALAGALPPGPPRA